MNTFVTLQIVAGITRHVMTGAGLWLVSEGYTDEQTAETLTGGVVALASVLWSAKAKFVN